MRCRRCGRLCAPSRCRKESILKVRCCRREPAWADAAQRIILTSAHWLRVERSKDVERRSGRAKERHTRRAIPTMRLGRKETSRQPGAAAAFAAVVRSIPCHPGSRQPEAGERERRTGSSIRHKIWVPPPNAWLPPTSMCSPRGVTVPFLRQVDHLTDMVLHVSSADQDNIETVLGV